MKKRARFRREIKYKGYEIYYQERGRAWDNSIKSGYKVRGTHLIPTTLKECKWAINQWIIAKKMVDEARKAGMFYL